MILTDNISEAEMSQNFHFFFHEKINSDQMIHKIAVNNKGM